VKRLVIDTDPGVDDALALLLAFADADTRVEAVTVVAGNVGLDRTVANACTILDVLGADPAATPVFRGCDRSLLGDRVEATSHGADGLGNAQFPPSSRRVEAEHAADALVRLASESPGELMLVARDRQHALSVDGVQRGVRPGGRRGRAETLAGDGAGALGDRHAVRHRRRPAR
jgi:inosine-uridine nucleoside N-ribohydrolase